MSLENTFVPSRRRRLYKRQLAMANFIEPEKTFSGAYQGLERIFQYTNADGALVRYNCGQAAAATYLTFREIFPASAEDALEVMQQIETDNPPDNLGGWFGTSRRCIERIGRRHSTPLDEIEGEVELRSWLSRREPVIVMLGVAGLRLLNRIAVPAGHWSVAYGFDEKHIYLTNHGKLTWQEFRRGWNSLVPRLIQMNNRGLLSARK